MDQSNMFEYIGSFNTYFYLDRYRAQDGVKVKQIRVFLTDFEKVFLNLIIKIIVADKNQSRLQHTFNYINSKAAFPIFFIIIYPLQIGTRKIRFNDLKFIGQPSFKPWLFP